MTRSPRNVSTRLATTMLATLLGISACAGAAPATSPGDGPPSSRPSQDLPDRISPSPSGAPVTGEVPAAIVAEARALLAGVVGEDAAAAATILVAEAVTWPDGSLGCPEPGILYTQQLVDGYRLVLDVDGRSYDYRATGGGNVRACELAGPRGS